MADQQVVVITGASGGIGAALALILARQGASLALVARRAEALNAVVAQCGAGAIGLVEDVTSRAAVDRVVAGALERFGHVDVWVNNVGQGIARPATQTTDDDIDTMMRINVKTALYGMQAILPHFVARGRGHVINVSSMLGRIPYVGIRAAYSASKHYLNALTADFRAEVQATHPDIQFSVVTPGPVATEFGSNAVHAPGPTGPFPGAQSAEEVAGVIASVIATRRPDVYTQAGMRQRVADYYAAIGVDP